MTGVGLGRYSILCYWLIPNYHTKDGISIFIFIVMGGAGVKGTQGLECGSNGRIILGDEEALVFCTGLLVLVRVYGGFVPSMLQEGIVIVIFICRSKRG